MKRLGMLVYVLAVLAIATAASAQGFDKAGTAGFQTLKLGVGARAAAIGEAFVAMADDPSAAYWNPAGLARQGYGVLASGIQWPADINIGSVIATVPSPLGTFAVSATVMSTGYMIRRTDARPEGDGSVFRAGEYIYALSWGTGFTDRFSFGVTAKMLQQDIAEYSDRSWAFDVGTLYMITPKLWMGMSAQNFGPDLGYSYDNDGDGATDEDPNNSINDDGDGKTDEDGPEASVPLPLMFQVGFAYTAYEAGPNKFVTSVRGLHFSDNREEVALGGEYGMANMLFLRGGYRFNRDAGTWTTGLGVRLPFAGSSASVDYAFSEFGNLNAAHRASLTLQF